MVRQDLSDPKSLETRQSAIGREPPGLISEEKDEVTISEDLSYELEFQGFDHNDGNLNGFYTQRC